MGKYNLIALTNPIDGLDDEFNDWYTNEHLDDVLKLPGVMAAQRFCLNDVQHRRGPGRAAIVLSDPRPLPNCHWFVPRGR